MCVALCEHSKNQRAVNYDSTKVVEALRLLLTASAELGTIETYLYDIVDLSRQVLSDIFIVYLSNFDEAYKTQNLTRVDASVTKLLQVIMDHDAVLATNVHYLFGVWIANARAWASTAQEADLLEYNARTQLTTWGPLGEINDYGMCVCCVWFVCVCVCISLSLCSYYY